jgi:2-dehydropantoate 2-reductase
MDHLIFGELDGSRSSRLERFLEVCRTANFQSTLSTNIAVDIWTKFTRLAVFSGLTTVTRSPIGAIINDPELRDMLKAAVGEALAVAHAKGISVPDSTVDDVARAYAGLPPQAKSSMLEDLERGRRLELPWLSGAVARMGAELGVPTPTHRFISTVLGPFVNGAPEETPRAEPRS